MQSTSALEGKRCNAPSAAKKDISDKSMETKPPDLSSYSSSLHRASSVDLASVATACCVLHSRSLTSDADGIKTQIFELRDSSSALRFDRAQVSQNFSTKQILTEIYKSIGCVTDLTAASELKSPLLAAGFELSCHAEKMKQSSSEMAKYNVKYQYRVGTFKISLTDVCRCDGACECKEPSRLVLNKHFVEAVQELVTKYGENLSYHHMEHLFKEYGEFIATEVTVGVYALKQQIISRSKQESLKNVEGGCMAKLENDNVNIRVGAQHTQHKNAKNSEDVSSMSFNTSSSVWIDDENTLKDLQKEAEDAKNWRVVHLSGLLPITRFLPKMLADKCQAIEDRLAKIREKAIEYKLRTPDLEHDFKFLGKAIQEAKHSSHRLAMCFAGYVPALINIITTQEDRRSKKFCLRAIDLLLSLSAEFASCDVPESNVMQCLDLAETVVKGPGRSKKEKFLQLLAQDYVANKFLHHNVYHSTDVVMACERNIEKSCSWLWLKVDVFHGDTLHYYSALMLATMSRTDTMFNTISWSTILSKIVNTVSQWRMVDVLHAIIVKSGCGVLLASITFGQRHLRALIEHCRSYLSLTALHGLLVHGNRENVGWFLANNGVAELSSILSSLAPKNLSVCLEILTAIVNTTEITDDHKMSLRGVDCVLGRSYLQRDIMIMAFHILACIDSDVSNLIMVQSHVDALAAMLERTDELVIKSGCLVLQKLSTCDHSIIITRLIALLYHKSSIIQEHALATLCTLAQSGNNTLSHAALHPEGNYKWYLALFRECPAAVRCLALKDDETLAHVIKNISTGQDAITFTNELLLLSDSTQSLLELLRIIFNVSKLDCCSGLSDNVIALLSKALCAVSSDLRSYASDAVLQLASKPGATPLNFNSVFAAILDLLRSDNDEKAVLGSDMCVKLVSYACFVPAMNTLVEPLICHLKTLTADTGKRSDTISCLRILISRHSDGYILLVNENMYDVLVNFVIDNDSTPDVRVDSLNTLASVVTTLKDEDHKILLQYALSWRISNDLAPTWRRYLCKIVEMAANISAVVLCKFCDLLLSHFESLHTMFEFDSIVSLLSLIVCSIDSATANSGAHYVYRIAKLVKRGATNQSDGTPRWMLTACHPLKDALESLKLSNGADCDNAATALKMLGF